MTRLSLLDQAFLKIEQGGMSPLYMGGAMILDPSTSPEPLAGAGLAEHLAAVMEEVPIMRQRLVQDGLRIGSMRLVDDPNFDVRRHVNVARLDGPAGYAELTEYLGRFSTRRLRLDRPLWRFEVVEGLEGGRIAVAMHLHHAILDGMGARRALAGMWSERPVPARAPRPAGSWRAVAQPGRVEMLGDALLENARRLYVDAPSFLLRNAAPMLRVLGAELGRRLQSPRDGQGAGGAALPRPRKTSLNVGRLSPRRAVAYLELPLAEAKALREAHGCTINDLALFINSWALEHYFAASGERLDFDLICAMLIDARGEGDASAGNAFAFARLNLHNTIADPGRRLAAIAADTLAVKRSAGRGRERGPGARAIDFGAFGNLFSPILLEALVYGATQFNLLEKATFVNVPITNVPGSPVPMYIAGARLVSNIPMAPCVDTLALTVTITSTERLLLIGYHACAEALGDKELLVEGARRAIGALRAAPGSRPAAAAKRGAGDETPAKTEAEAGAKAKARPASGAQAKAGARPGGGTQAKAEAGAKARAKPDSGTPAKTEAGVKARARPGGGTQAKTKAETGTKVKAKPASGAPAKTKAETGTKARARPGGGAQAKTKAETGAKAKLRPASGAKAKAKAETGTKARARPGGGVPAKTKAETGAKAKLRPASGAQAKTKAETGTKARARPGSGAPVKAKTKTGAKAKAGPASGAQAKVEAEAGAKARPGGGAKAKAKARGGPRARRKPAPAGAG